ncbi:ABC transporter ATP-binding protein [Nesterenkonia ebinurensis]|uniref:ABC transporter ATP-binding protein n=1 Tax=Nesterenkonia ebinurensis TaxID=2608252 RepID=UPI00123CF346|nr:ATP-binding cassette domain-containing protein [Nesterenkonia ebinurensis]
MSSVLQLSGITIGYDDAHGRRRHVAEGFDLALEAGAFHCIAGRSGSGKTSLLRVAIGTQIPDEGTVYWSGQDIRQLSRDALARLRREHMGYVDQDTTVISELSALDNVLVPAVPQGVKAAERERAYEVLELLGLKDVSRNPAGALSGGERQRLAIGRALLLRPRVLCMDEPTASLDVATATDVVAAAQAVTDSGSSVLVASHDPVVIDAADSVTRLE